MLILFIYILYPIKKYDYLIIYYALKYPLIITFTIIVYFISPIQILALNMKHSIYIKGTLNLYRYIANNILTLDR